MRQGHQGIGGEEDEDGAVVPVAIISLFAIGVVITASPVIYQTVEKLEMVFVAIILVFIVVAIVIATTSDAWSRTIMEIPGGVAGFPGYAVEIGAASSWGRWPSPGPAAPTTSSRATGSGTRVWAWVLTSRT